jgi:hypothetical protein
MKARPDEDAKEPRRWDFYVDFAGSDIRSLFSIFVPPGFGGGLVESPRRPVRAAASA